MNTVKLAQLYAEKAKLSKKDFSMSFSNFCNVRTQTHCAYSGIKFEADGDFSLSYERLDCSKGYEDGNVVPVCRVINTVRGCIPTSAKVDETIKFYQEKLDARYVELEKLRKRKFDLENTPLIDKPIIRAENVREFYHNLNIWNIKTNVIKNRNQSLITVKNQLAKARKAKTILNIKTVMESHQTAINDANRVKARVKLRCQNMYINRKSNCLGIELFAETDVFATLNEFKDIENGILKNIEKYKGMLKLYPYVKTGLARFENLSMTDKMCLKIGYPLGTPKAKVIKQAMAMKLANEVW